MGLLLRAARDVILVGAALASVVAAVVAVRALRVADRQADEQTQARIAATQPLLVARTGMAGERDLLPNYQMTLVNEGPTSAIDVVAAVLRPTGAVPVAQISSIAPNRKVLLPVPEGVHERLIYRYSDARRERLWTLVISLVGGAAPCLTIDNQATVESTPHEVQSVVGNGSSVLAAWASREYQDWVSSTTRHLMESDVNGSFQGPQVDQVDLHSCLSIMRTVRQYERTQGRGR